MAETEEPVFTSLAARKAALMQNQGGGNSTKNGISFGKRPPPPPPPEKRPALPLRTQTLKNPPIATYGSSVTKAANSQPINAKGQALLPPPPVDRDQAQPTSSSSAKSPGLPACNGPPALPSRKASQPSPALPPRRTSTQLTRRGSNDSTMSFSSTISGMSLGHSTTASSVDSQRRLPPALGEAKLPPLPPSRRDLEETTKPGKLPLVTAKSTPNVHLREPPPVDRDLAPKMPPRPNGASTQSSRPTGEEAPRLPSRTREEQPPRMPARPGTDNPIHTKRTLPPPASNILAMGFSNKKDNPAFSNKDETPMQPLRPIPTFTKPTGPVVTDVTKATFDRTIRGKYAFITFGRPSTCWNCQQLAPHWEEIQEKFNFASDRLIIAKNNVDDDSLSHKYQVRKLPTLILFDGDANTYDTFREGGGQWTTEELVEYLERKTGIKVSDGLQPRSNGVPPPIPLATKPQSGASRPAPTLPPAGTDCLLCRDFSGPDGVAQQYPRQTLPRSHDLTGYLADVLCSPFPSYTDKARAIFSWLHHNINYDVDAFFNKTVKHMEPIDTIHKGLAVCGGYAGLYAAIALKAGLECVMVTGHGKGYGYTRMQPGERPPPREPTGHAWNAVRIDGGEWKLLDPCWGAGNVLGEGSREYKKDFTPSWLTMSNEDFGLKHFPQDERYFFHADGSVPTWEEYMRGPTQEEPLTINGKAEDNGLSEKSFQPSQKYIRVDTRTRIRFQFSKVCEHWDHERNGKGKPYCVILKVGGRDGKKDDFIAFESNDMFWWVDVNARGLGVPGQTVSVYTVTSVNDKDARGMTKEQYLAKKGKPGSMGFGVICAWELV